MSDSSQPQRTTRAGRVSVWSLLAAKPMSNFDQQRARMVRDHVAARGVGSPHVLSQASAITPLPSELPRGVPDTYPFGL
jgi:hypothetical protein